MNSQTTPRQQLIEAIPHLSDRQVILVLQLVQSLYTQSNPALTDPLVDPLSEFIGANTHGRLASAIDETLYG
jgi:hypothetical protein